MRRGMNRNVIGVIGLMLLQVGLLQAQGIEKGIEYHDRFLESQEPADAQAGIAILEQPELLASPAGSLARAYRGSLYTLQAAVAEAEEDLIRAVQLLDRGFAELDRAVADDPDNASIRVLRAINSIEVSQGSPVDRFAEASRDIDWLTGRETEHSETALLYWLQGELAYHTGDLDDALDAWEAAWETDPESEYGQLSDDRLWDLQE